MRGATTRRSGLAVPPLNCSFSASTCADRVDLAATGRKPGDPRACRPCGTCAAATLAAHTLPEACLPGQELTPRKTLSPGSNPPRAALAPGADSAAGAFGVSDVQATAFGYAKTADDLAAYLFAGKREPAGERAPDKPDNGRRRGTSGLDAPPLRLGQPLLAMRAPEREPESAGHGRLRQRVRRSLPGAWQARLPSHVHVAEGDASPRPCGDPARRRGRTEPSPLFKVLHTE